MLLLDFALVAVMVIGLLLVPLGLPGLWLMVVALLGGVVVGSVSVFVLLLMAALALLAELLEFVAVKRLSDRHGGSRRAFWGALAGGVVGAFVGVPVPLVGSVVGAIVGTFVGAMLVTAAETRRMKDSLHVGWGAALGRGASMLLKLTIGTAILLIGGSALLF